MIDFKTNNIMWVLGIMEHKLRDRRCVVLPRDETVTSSKWFFESVRGDCGVEVGC